MSNNGEFDDFKDNVYREIRWLEFYEKDLEFGRGRSRASGCLGAAFSAMFGGLFREGRRRMKNYRRVNESSETASQILGRPALKKELCNVLDESIRLPIDVANVIIPVLYNVKGKSESIPRDPVLYALIARRIAEEGVVKFCFNGD